MNISCTLWSRGWRQGHLGPCVPPGRILPCRSRYPGPSTYGYMWLQRLALTHTSLCFLSISRQGFCQTEMILRMWRLSFSAIGQDRVESPRYKTRSISQLVHIFCTIFQAWFHKPIISTLICLVSAKSATCHRCSRYELGLNDKDPFVSISQIQND